MKIMTGKKYCSSDAPFKGQNGRTLTGKPWFFAYGGGDATTVITAGESPVFVGGCQQSRGFDFTGQTKPGVINPGETKRVKYCNGTDTWLMEDLPS